MQSSQSVFASGRICSGSVKSGRCDDASAMMPALTRWDHLLNFLDESTRAAEDGGAHGRTGVIRLHAGEEMVSSVWQPLTHTAAMIRIIHKTRSECVAALTRHADSARRTVILWRSTTRQRSLACPEHIQNGFNQVQGARHTLVKPTSSPRLSCRP
jgi:hypothetical protein